MKRRKCSQGLLLFNIEDEERTALSVSLFLPAWLWGKEKQASIQNWSKRMQSPL